MDDQHLARKGFTLARWLVAACAFGLMAAGTRAAGWRKLTTPYFTVISDASDDRTRAWAAEFEQFRRGVETLLPLPPGRLEPVQVVLFAGDGSFKAFRPIKDGKPEPVAGYYVMGPSRPVIACSIAGARDDTRTKIYTGASLWYLSGFDRRPPDCISQGLAELFGTFNLRGASFEIGITQSHYLRRVRASLPMPFAELAAIRSDSLQFRGPTLERTERYFAQSWLMAHELILAPDAPGFPALRRYLDDPGAGEPVAEFAAAMGRTPAEIDTRLKAHLYRRFDDPFRTALDRGALDTGFQLEPAAPADVDLALGALLIAVNRPAEAAAYLWRAAAALPSDPRPYEALGEMELGASHASDAESHYRDALTRGSKNYFARFVVANAKIREQLGGMQMSRPEESDVAEALDLLAQCLAHNPRFLSAYESLARVLCVVEVQTRAVEMQALLREGLRRSPRHPDLLLASGFVAARGGRRDEAKTFLQKARQWADQGDGRLARIIERLEKNIAAGGAPKD